jgi:transposase-like protein
MSKKSTIGARRRWSTQEKAKIVRRHLREEVSLADLADETGAAPGQISQWCKQGLEGLEGVFDRSGKKQERQMEQAVAARDARIRELQEVVTELSTEVLSLKKSVGVR